MKAKRILAMLMAMCMLAACSMVVSAGEGDSEATNYLVWKSGATEPTETTPQGNMMKVALTPEDGVPNATSYFKLDTTTELWKKSGSSCLYYETTPDIPAGKFLFSVWYKTSTDLAHVQFQYKGGAGSVTVTLPETGDTWKQFFVVVDALHGMTTTTDPETGEITAAYFNDASGNATDAAFTGFFVNLMRPKTGYNRSGEFTADDYICFCNPTLTLFNEDIAGVFETGVSGNNETSSIYYCYTNTGAASGNYTFVWGNAEADKIVNILGAKEASVAAGSEVTLKFASADDSAEAAKAQTGQVLLAAYEENGTKLSAVEIVPSTAGTGGATCTIPASFAGKPVKAFFWNSLGALTPIAAPATITVPAA